MMSSDFEDLRSAALQRLEERKSSKNGGGYGILRITVWKNMTIRKRRKTQFLLLLLQILIWFGIACFSLATRSGRLEYLAEPEAGVTQLVPRLRPIDLKLPVAIGYDGASIAEHNDAEYFNYFNRTFEQLMRDWTNYYRWTYGNRSPPLRLFRSRESLIAGLRDDRRIPFGIYLNSLGSLSNYTLLFWEKEVPVGDDASPFNCRNSITGWNWGICQEKLYGQYGFMMAQSAMNNALIRNKIGTDENQSTVMTDKPNRFRLEFPGVSVVAEKYPEHPKIRSQAAESAGSAPFYFMFALVSVFSFVVMDMVGEKESK